MEVVIANKVVIVGFLFALSEVLALIPSVKANSVFQVIVNVLKKVSGK
jgi:hypothetical protein